ncbi:MAG TPA: hypothetical protein VM487_03915 [Phycisphaerae bacterium]|nr:hypothetical protein [Phycisphaerae bacterium]HUU94862.1 hypothetical protein [Phycisphaerae bacterium]
MERNEWLRKYAAWQGRVQQLVSEDLDEHGTPHFERGYTIDEVRQFAVDIGGLAFELYAAVAGLQQSMGKTLADINLEVEEVRRKMEAMQPGRPVFPDDVRWADGDPGERNGKGE